MAIGKKLHPSKKPWRYMADVHVKLPNEDSRCKVQILLRTKSPILLCPVFCQNYFPQWDQNKTENLLEVKKNVKTQQNADWIDLRTWCPNSHEIIRNAYLFYYWNNLCNASFIFYCHSICKKVSNNLFVTSKNEFSKCPI